MNPEGSWRVKPISEGVTDYNGILVVEKELFDELKDQLYNMEMMNDEIERLNGVIDHQKLDIAWLREVHEKYEKRLEIDHVYSSYRRGPIKRVEIPPEERHKQIDGISARDETIKGQEEAIKRLKAELKELQTRKCIFTVGSTHIKGSWI